MNRVPVSSLKVNTYFDAPLLIDEDYIVLSPDTPVTLELINRLKAWDYREILTEGRESEGPQGLAVEDPAAVVTSLEESVEEKEAQTRVPAFYAGLLSDTAQIYRRLSEEGTLDMSSISERVKHVMDTLKSHRDALLSCLSRQHVEEDYLVSQCAGTAVLSVALGTFLKLPPHRLIELGSAALLHKAGMTRLPRALYAGSHILSTQERKSLAAHPAAAYRMLKALSVNENIARGVLEHQERYDGSGYPRGLSGDAISAYARIIAVACSYMAIISPRPYRAASDPHSAITDLLRTNRKAYDEQVLKALVYTLSVYPVGMYVLLQNGVRGVVYRTNPDDPRCPIVKPILDQEGKRVADAPLIKTSIEKQIMIVRALRPEEIADAGAR